MTLSGRPASCKRFLAPRQSNSPFPHEGTPSKRVGFFPCLRVASAHYSAVSVTFLDQSDSNRCVRIPGLPSRRFSVLKLRVLAVPVFSAIPSPATQCGRPRPSPNGDRRISRDVPRSATLFPQWSHGRYGASRGVPMEARPPPGTGCYIPGKICSGLNRSKSVQT